MSTSDAITERRVWTIATLLRRVRRLPTDGQVLFREQRSVRAGDIVARAEQPKPPVILAVSRALRLRSEPVEPHLLRRPGDAVAAGEVIARVKGPLGIGSRSCASPVSGTLVSGPAGSGDYLVIPTPEPVELTAHYPGIITTVIPQHGVVVQTTAVGAQGVVGCGGEGGGAIRVVASASEPISSGRLGPKLAGALIVGGSIDLATLRRAVVLEIGGVIVGSLRGSAYEAYLQDERKIPLLVIDGFGAGGMSEAIHELLRRHEGREGRLTTGGTPLGSGADGQPPEILVPVASPEAPRDRPLSLHVGSLVRIAAGSGAAAAGRVSAVGRRPVTHAPGVVGEWVEIAIGDGQPIRVPLSNVELMAEPA